MNISRHPLPRDDTTSLPGPDKKLCAGILRAFLHRHGLFWPYVLLPLFRGNPGYGSFMIGVLMGTT